MHKVTTHDVEGQAPVDDSTSRDRHVDVDLGGSRSGR